MTKSEYLWQKANATSRKATKQRQKGYAARHRARQQGDRRKATSLSVVEPVPKNQLVPGRVVWAHIPFEAGEGDKGRPAVVLETRGRSVTVRPGYSTLTRHRFPGRYTELNEWSAAGLGRPTGIQRRDVELDIVDVVAIVGQLSEDDHAVVLGARPALTSSLAPTFEAA